jgi:NADPH-dependent F420 reductase
VTPDHAVRVGSRDAERGQEAARSYRERVPEAAVTGGQNAAIVAGADVVVLSVPPYHVESTLDGLADRLDPGTVLLTPAVGLRSDESGWHYHAPPAGSVTALVAETAPDSCSVVGALHNVPAGPLADPSASITFDTPVLGDDENAVDTVVDLLEDLAGVRPITAGPIANAPEAEGLVALLLNLEGNDGRGGDLGIRIVG